MQSGSPFAGQNKNSQSRNPILSSFNAIISDLSYGKVVRGSFFLLFVISILKCLFSPDVQTVSAGILSLIAFVSFDVVCAFKRPKFKDFSEEINELKNRNEKLEQQFKEIKEEASIANVGAVFGRKK